MPIARRIWHIAAIGLILLYCLGIYSNLTDALSFRGTDAGILKAIDKHPGCTSSLDTFAYRGYRVAMASVECPDKAKRDAVFFVHGSPSSLDAFTLFLAREDLAEKTDMYTYDRPGYGETRPRKVLMHLVEHSEMLVDLVRKVDARRNVFVGHSLGCSIIAQLAMDHPDLCDGVVMVSPPIDPALEPSNWWRPIIDYPVVRIALPKSMTMSNRELLWLEKDLEAIEDRWSSIECPVVLMHGTDDRLVPVENVAFGKEKLQSEVVVDTLVNEGHFILWTHADRVAGHILSLLEGSNSGENLR